MVPTEEFELCENAACEFVLAQARADNTAALRH